MNVNQEVLEVMESPHFKALDELYAKKVREAIKSGNVGKVEWYDKPTTVLVWCYDPMTLRYVSIPVSADDYRKWFQEMTGRTCKF